MFDLFRRNPVVYGETMGGRKVGERHKAKEKFIKTILNLSDLIFLLFIQMTSLIKAFSCVPCVPKKVIIYFFEWR